MPIRSLSSDEVREAGNLLGSIPDRRAKLGKHPADLVNVLMFGSRRQIELAFHAAGGPRLNENPLWRSIACIMP